MRWMCMVGRCRSTSGGSQEPPFLPLEVPACRLTCAVAHLLHGSSREQMPEAGVSYGLLSGRPFLSVTMVANATSVYVQQAVDTSKGSWASVALLLEVLACRLTCIWLLLPYTRAVQPPTVIPQYARPSLWYGAC